MDSKFNKISRKIKRMFGLCEYRGCVRRTYADVEIPAINVKRGLCIKHTEIFTKGSTSVESKFIRSDKDMEYVSSITEKQFKTLERSEDIVKSFKKIVGLSDSDEYGMGDTSVTVDNAKKYDLFKILFKNETFSHYYLIVSDSYEGIAFAWTLYPREK